jgi:hypothetical protein
MCCLRTSRTGLVSLSLFRIGELRAFQSKFRTNVIAKKVGM